MEGLFKFILISSFYGTLVGGIVLATKKILKDKISAKWHYLLWSVLVIKLILPYGPKSQWSLFNLLESDHRMKTETTLQIAPSSVQEWDEPFGNQMTAIEKEEGPINVQSHRVELSEYRTEVVPSGNLADEVAIDWMRILSILWLIGSMGYLMKVIGSYYVFRKELRAYPISQEESIIKTLEKCHKQLGVKNILQVRIQEHIKTPALVGILKPEILITKQVLDLELYKLEYILAHELAHYKRKDHLSNGFLLALESIHWFNPILKYYFKCIRQDMELCADEKVIESLEILDPKTYGETLLDMITYVPQGRMVQSALMMASHKKSLKQRIAYSVQNQWFKKHGKKALFLSLAAIGTLSILLLTTRSNEVSYSYIEDTLETLWENKTPYVGNNSKVNGLFGAFEYASYCTGIELKTTQEPYGVIATYNWEAPIPNEITQAGFYRHAIQIFVLVENVDYITYILENIEGLQEPYELTFSREQMQKTLKESLGVYGASKDALSKLLLEQSLQIVGSPSYSQLSSEKIIGVRLDSLSIGTPNNSSDYKVVYETTDGQFLASTTYTDTGISLDERLNLKGKTFVTRPHTLLYWTPKQGNGDFWRGDKTVITLKLYGESEELLGQSELTISYEDGYYTVHNPGLRALSEEIDTNILEIYSRTDGGEYLLEYQEREGQGVHEILMNILEERQMIKLNQEPVVSEDYKLIYKDIQGNQMTYSVWLNLKMIQNEVLIKDSLGKYYTISAEDEKTLSTILKGREGLYKKDQSAYKGYVNAIEYKEDKAILELVYQGSRSRFTVGRQDLEAYGVVEGDLIEIKIEYEGVYPKIIELIQLNSLDLDKGLDVGYVHMMESGAQPIQEAKSWKIGEYTLHMTPIYGDVYRMGFGLYVENLPEGDYDIELDSNYPMDINMYTSTSYGPEGYTFVEIIHYEPEEIIGTTLHYRVYVKELKSDESYGQVDIQIGIPNEPLLDAKVYQPKSTFHGATGSITLEKASIYPSTMLFQLSSQASDREITGLYKPVVYGDREGIYGGTLRFGSTSKEGNFSEGIIPSAYYEQNEELILKSEGYTYKLLEPIKRTLKPGVKYKVKSGENLITLESEYAGGQLKLSYIKDENIESLSSIIIDGEKVQSSRYSTRGDDPETHTHYIEIPYKESYEMVLEFEFIEREGVSIGVEDGLRFKIPLYK